MQSHPTNGELLEALCFYRGLYAHMRPDDRTSTMSVEAAVRYGEGLLRVVRRRDEFAARRRSQTTDTSVP
jgi:hypothetical protein